MDMDVDVKGAGRGLIETGELVRSNGSPGQFNVAAIRDLIDAKNGELLTHRYFRLCQTNAIDRKQLVEIVKQLYCFSVFFERLLTRRVAEYTSAMDPRVIQIARKHLREEI